MMDGKSLPALAAATGSVLLLSAVWWAKQSNKKKKIVYDLQDKVILVTGASAGIGKELVRALASRTKGNVKLVLVARRQAELDSLAKELQEEQQSNTNNNKLETLVVTADISKESDCQQMIERTVQKFGRLDVLICNAGISMTSHFDAFKSVDLFRQIMDVNYFGTLYCVFHAWKYLTRKSNNKSSSSDQKNDDGTMIVAVSSMVGKLGVPTRTGYAASKFAIHGFLESLRLEIKMGMVESSKSTSSPPSPSSPHILLACPGFVQTDIRTKYSDAERTLKVDEASMMTAPECASWIVDAMERKDRQVFVVRSLATKLGPLLHVLFPNFCDKVVIKKAQDSRS